MRKRHDAVLDAEQIHDGRCSRVCGIDAVVGGDDQQHEIDPGRSGEHVVDETLVPRHVDEADDLSARRRQVGEAEIDRDAARLLLLQAVGVDAGQRLTSAVLPWSIWPAVPTIMCVISGSGAFARRSASAICSR